MNISDIVMAPPSSAATGAATAAAAEAPAPVSWEYRSTLVLTTLAILGETSRTNII